MRMSMRKLSFVSMSLFLLFCGRVLSQQAVVACGGMAFQEGSEISFSVGQAVVFHAYAESYFLYGGVQQPYEAGLVSNEMFVSAEEDFEAWVYPNPVRTGAMVCCPSASRNRSCELRVMDNLGRLKESCRLEEREKEIDMSTMPSGMYVFVFADSEGRILQYKKVLKAGE